MNLIIVLINSNVTKMSKNHDPNTILYHLHHNHVRQKMLYPCHYHIDMSALWQVVNSFLLSPCDVWQKKWSRWLHSEITKWWSHEKQNVMKISKVNDSILNDRMISHRIAMLLRDLCQNNKYSHEAKLSLLCCKDTTKN